ncbi:MAG: hypothetical protein GY724_13070 [Actinomycetia bacterium]|nr:hypothetical protein [Actinomycetes bacterium]MCP4225514.1 hypothetical protein [Actinomycetes bacterium]MCP5031229.1 hypothetical protein [Actinomycetes bacterium]
MADEGAAEINLTTALTTLVLAGSSPIVIKRRLPIDHWQIKAITAQAKAEARQRTECEAQWLVAARHHGVVRLRRVSGSDARLETELASVSTLRTVSLTWAQVASTLGAVATTLADVHHDGLVHANLSPEHIIVEPGGRRPVLCSPSPRAMGLGPARDLAALATIATSFGPEAGCPAEWSEVVEALETCVDTAESARVFRHLAVSSTRARARRWLNQRAVLRG